MERAGEHNRITVERGLHVSEDQLESYALGRLPDSDVSLLEEHLILCAACRENLDRIGDAALGLREALNAYPAPELAAARSRDWFSWVRRPVFPMAIAFAAILGVIAVLSINKPALAPVASIQLMATRGEMATAAPAREFDLTLADGPRQGGPFRVEVVNVVGAKMWSGFAVGAPAGVQAKVEQRLPAGDYFVRLYSPAGTLMREYGFHVRA
jgi:anti-sigma factor RsiW